MTTVECGDVYADLQYLGILTSMTSSRRSVSASAEQQAPGALQAAQSYIGERSHESRSAAPAVLQRI